MNIRIYLLVVATFLTFVMMECESITSIDYDLIDFELVNIDNSGQKAFESGEPIQKESFVIGLKAIVLENGVTENSLPHKPYYLHAIEQIANDHDDIHIRNVKINAPQIICNMPFFGLPANSDVTHLFKIESSYYNTEYIKDCSSFFILHEIPEPGSYSFKIVYLETNGQTIERNTKPINLF